MSGRVIVPPDHIVARMKQRTEALFDNFGRVTGEDVTRALIEAWVEGANAGADRTGAPR
jgi:hypothetical protein